MTDLYGAGSAAAGTRNLLCRRARTVTRFLLPVRFGDTITAKATVQEVIKERYLVRLALSCTNQRGEEVLSGSAEIKVLKEVVTEE